MLQLIGRKTCKNTRKAERFLKERKIEFQYIDPDNKELSAGELKSIFNAIDPEFLIDRNSKEFDKRGFKYMDFDIADELAREQKLFVTPILREGGRSVSGYDELLYKKFLEKK
jgi:arsenate reductase-like glutaredoxin family protein